MIPSEMVKNGGLLTFTFKMPGATSPKPAGLEDTRVLGMCVHELENSESRIAGFRHSPAAWPAPRTH